MNLYSYGKFIPHDVHQELRQKFAYVEQDHHGTDRIFLDNSGGSFRLKNAVKYWSELDLICDCPERKHDIAKELIATIEEGKVNISKIFGTSSGTGFIRYTASLCNYELIDIAAEQLPGKNIVTTILEHPSSYDACVASCKKYGKELRVANVNKNTGEILENEILSLVDQDTAFVNLIYASNITGAILDLESLIPKLRSKKKDLYVISDAVQHAPHHLIHFEEIGLDACTVALYKMFGPRGIGLAWVSDRFSELIHHRLQGKPSNDWSLGSPSPAFYRSITEVVRYIEWLGEKAGRELPGKNTFEQGMNAIFLHEKALLHFLLVGNDKQRGLNSIPGVRVHFLDQGIDNKDLIIALSIDDQDPDDTVKKYADHHVTVYERVSSSIYSKRMIEALGLTGVVRVSPIHVQNVEEMKRFLQITELITK